MEDCLAGRLIFLILEFFFFNITKNISNKIAWTGNGQKCVNWILRDNVIITQIWISWARRKRRNCYIALCSYDSTLHMKCTIKIYDKKSWLCCIFLKCKILNYIPSSNFKSLINCGGISILLLFFFFLVVVMQGLNPGLNAW